MSELTVFLAAMIDADEATARAAQEGPWDDRDDPDLGELRTPHPHRGTVAWVPADTDRAHIARHDPVRVLAECAAKRAIVAEHRRADWDVQGHATCETCVSPDDWTVVDLPAHLIYPCRTLRLLAAPYASEPGFRDEWHLDGSEGGTR